MNDCIIKSSQRHRIARSVEEAVKSRVLQAGIIETVVEADLAEQKIKVRGRTIIAKQTFIDIARRRAGDGVHRNVDHAGARDAYESETNGNDQRRKITRGFQRDLGLASDCIMKPRWRQYTFGIFLLPDLIKVEKQESKAKSVKGEY